MDTSFSIAWLVRGQLKYRVYLTPFQYCKHPCPTIQCIWFSTYKSIFYYIYSLRLIFSVFKTGAMLVSDKHIRLPSCPRKPTWAWRPTVVLSVVKRKISIGINIIKIGNCQYNTFHILEWEGNILSVSGGYDVPFPFHFYCEIRLTILPIVSIVVHSFMVLPG